MSGIKDQHNLDELRERLYSRGSGDDDKLRRHDLSPKKKTNVPENWERPKSTVNGDVTPPERPVSEKSPAQPQPVSNTPPRVQPTARPQHQLIAGHQAPRGLNQEKPATATTPPSDDATAMPKKKRRYRKYVLITSFAVLLVAMAYSIILLFFGGNQISSSNLAVTIDGPFSIGGGEELPLEVTVINGNSVPIKSATLIVSYPPGTKSSAEDSRDLFEERLPLRDIGPGEEVTVPIRPVVFGEENQELTIEVTVEYRLENSNGVFFKDAEPFTFKISSSPLVIRIDAIDQISSGQQTDIILTLRSNSPTPLNNILLVAEYPRGFDYTVASPAPSLGQNTWLIDTIEPEGSYEITLTGVVVGQEKDEFELKFSAGSRSEINQFSLGSVLTNANTSILIERPFVDVDMNINGDGDGLAILSPGQKPSFTISVTNTLEDAVYDVRVVATLGGNALNEEDVSVRGGFYDSVANEIRWSQNTESQLAELLPGDTEDFSFDLTLNDVSATPEVETKVDVFAKRVASVNASEELIGTVSGSAKIETEVRLGSEVRRVPDDAGPIPPQVETVTEYTINFLVEPTINDVSDAVITFQLPPYVTWQDESDGDGDVIYNPVSKEVTWDIGTISSAGAARLSVGVSLLPSVNQIGQIPTLINTQRLRATDRFTGTVVRTESAAKTTELSTELGFPLRNGTVVGQDEETD